MSDDRGVAQRLAELRQDFDRGFAVPPTGRLQEPEDLLAIRVAGEPYALRLREIAGIVTGRKLVPVPTAAADLLGLAGIRAGIVPVFGLASLLGHAATANSSRWIVLCGAEEPIALGFSDFEGYVRLAKSALHADRRSETARQYVESVANTDAGLRAVIGVSSIVATIRNRIGGADSQRGNHQ